MKRAAMIVVALLAMTTQPEVTEAEVTGTDVVAMLEAFDCPTCPVLDGLPAWVCQNFMNAHPGDPDYTYWAGWCCALTGWWFACAAADGSFTPTAFLPSRMV